MPESAARAKLRRFIAAQSPQTTVAAGIECESRFKANPGDQEIRIAYFALQSAVRDHFPITRPEPTDPPVDAWDNENHPYWTTDPECVFNAAFDKLIEEHGHINAIVKLSQMQANGEPFPA